MLKITRIKVVWKKGKGKNIVFFIIIKPTCLFSTSYSDSHSLFLWSIRWVEEVEPRSWNLKTSNTASLVCSRASNLLFVYFSFLRCWKGQEQRNRKGRREQKLQRIGKSRIKTLVSTPTRSYSDSFSRFSNRGGRTEISKFRSFEHFASFFCSGASGLSLFFLTFVTLLKPLFFDFSKVMIRCTCYCYRVDCNLYWNAITSFFFFFVCLNFLVDYESDKNNV